MINILILLPFIAGLFILAMPKKIRVITGIVVLLVTLIGLFITIKLFRTTAIISFPWAGFGIDFSLRLDHFSSFIPLGITYNPITKSSWEGIGVTPDSLIKANRALYAAHQLALNHCIGKSEDSEWKANLENILTELNENPPAFKTVPFELKGYENAKEVFVTGTFNNWARKTIPLTKKGNIWSAEVECEPGRIQYQFIVDEIPMLDPDNELTVKEGEYTNSVKTLK